MSGRAGLRELRADLRAMGADDAPAPRAMFVAGLGARLAELTRVAVDGDVLPELEVLPPAPRSRRLPVVAASIAAAVVLLTAGVAALDATARRGTGVDAAAPAGAADAAAGEPTDGAGRDAPSPDSGAASGDDAGVSVGAGRPDGGRRAPGLLGPRTAAPRALVPAGPGAATPAVPAPAPDGAAPGGDATGTGGAPEPAAGEPAPVGLRGRGNAARVLLEWDRYDGADFAAYLVLRAAAPDDPDHPDASGRTMILLRVENRSHTSHQDTAKVSTTPRYRVVAVDRLGRVVGQSGVYEADPALGTTRAIHQLPRPTS